MCFFTPKGKTVEEIIAANSAGMSDSQKAEYAYELAQTVFKLVTKVDVTLVSVGGIADWTKIAQAQYPTLTDIKCPDSAYYSVSLTDLQAVLTRDWTNKIPYVADKFDCDKFANTLYDHLCEYYGINACFPVWGQTTAGYHGFNCAVVQDNKGNWVARLVEPQTSAVFVDQGPLGHYTPQSTAEYLAIAKINPPSSAGHAPGGK